MKNIFKSTKEFMRMAKDISQYSKIKKFFTTDIDVEAVVKNVIVEEEVPVVIEGEILAEPKVKKPKASKKKVVKETTEEGKPKKGKKKDA